MSLASMMLVVGLRSVAALHAEAAGTVASASTYWPMSWHRWWLESFWWVFLIRFFPHENTRLPLQVDLEALCQLQHGDEQQLKQLRGVQVLQLEALHGRTYQATVHNYTKGFEMEGFRQDSSHSVIPVNHLFPLSK